MPGSVIGKRMNLGYTGKVSRDADKIIVNRIVNGESNAISFGDAVFLNGDNTVFSAGSTITGVTDALTVNQFAGIAVATVIQATEYNGQSSSYQANKGCDILVRGTIIVPVTNVEAVALEDSGTSTVVPKAGSQVYYDPTKHAFTATNTEGTISIPASFTTGYIDGSGNAEITLLERNLI